jgi:glucokinase
MLPYKEVVYVDTVPHDIECILGADIGGTNSNFGFFTIANGSPELILSVHTKSKEIKDFPSLVQSILDYLKKTYGITVARSCFAAAGVVSSRLDYAKPTNVDLIIDAKKILEKTSLTCAFIVNDFEVIGYGLDLIDPQKLVLVNKGVERLYANKAILGAGTGLGKCIMDWNKYAGRYIPVASEGGHADFAIQNQLELDLANHIRAHNPSVCNISWEDVLSGEGIKRMYAFFCDRAHGAAGSILKHNGGPHPDEIFNSRHQDEHSWQTFELYTMLYARCAKNFALDALALGGIYIAGGIAAKNLPLFELDAFMQEFVLCGKQQELLKNVPIYVITDYNVSLYGAAQYMLLENMCN